MTSLLQQRKTVTQQVSPYVVTALADFAKKKWAGGCLSGKSAKFSIYHRVYSDGEDPEFDMILWVVVGLNKGVYLKDANGYQYPAYQVFIKFEQGSPTPVGFEVLGRTGSSIMTKDFSEAALRETLMDFITRNVPPRDQLSWDLERGETIRLL